MKKSFMTRVLATGLSLAMAFSLSAATNVTTAAAASKPAMITSAGASAKTLSVNVGEKTQIKVNAATKKTYKVSAVKASSNKIRVAKNTAGTVVTIRGLKATAEGAPAAVKVSFAVKKTGKTSKYSYVSKVNVVAKEAEVTQAITSVTQKSFTTLEVKFQTALEKIDGTFTITRVNDNQDIQVKGSALDTTDKTKVTLTTYISLTDGKEYSVKYTANDEAKTVYEGKVTVTDGTVAAVNITPLEVTVNVATEIKYQTLDANGLVLSEKNIKKTPTDIDVSWKSNLGTVDDSNGKLTLYNIGDTATFTVTYHTGKYDQTTGAEVGVISKEFDVTAVKDATVVSQYAYTAATEQPFLWSKVVPNNTIALSDGIETAQRTAFFLIKDAKGNNVTNTCGYTVESSDNSIVIADGNVKDGAPLVPVSKGTAYLMIKDADGKVVDTEAITVGDKRKLTTLKLSTNSVSVASTSALSNPEECAYVDVTAKDQYGDDIGGSADVTEMYTENYATDATVICNGKTVKIAGGTTTPAIGKKATDVYKVSVTDYAGNTMTTRLSATSVQVSGSATASVVFLDTTNDNKVVTSVDSTISESSTWQSKNKMLNVVIVNKKNGVVVGKAQTGKISSVKVTKNDGSVLAYTASGSSFKAEKIVSCPAISKVQLGNVKTNSAVSSVNDKLNICVTTSASCSIDPTDGWMNQVITKNLGVGTYTVRFVIQGLNHDATGSFTVTDSNTAVSATVKETNTGSVVNLKNFFGSTDNIEFFYGDRTIGLGEGFHATGLDYSINSNGTNVYVKSVIVEVHPANNSKQTVYVKVPINRTFTTSGKFEKATIWQP